MLQVIITEPKSIIDYHIIYSRAFNRTIKHLIDNPNDKQKLKQAIYYGVKYINTMDEPEVLQRANIELELQYISIIRVFISELTPKELIQIFPIEKTFDGNKSGWKDYYYTMERINEIGMDTIIGKQLDNLLCDYQNNELMKFLLAEISTVSDLRKLNGQKGIAEQWCEDNHIPTYTEYDDPNGCKYIQDNMTGDTARVKRVIPKYIQRVK